MHLALYRSERPENFNEIIGQKHIVKILNNQLKSGNISQSYLFTGTRGTGKTTTARIIAKAVNCIGDVPDDQKPCCECENCKAIKAGSFFDVIELDAASNNGVDDLRAIIESVQYPPAYGKYKVYIIDEVHMLSQSAENAFLKTLEEPPSYAIFILATTNPEKVRQTIRSRCMTLSFKRVSENDLIEGMRKICLKRGINITDEALAAVATRADGSVRDGLSILEQCISAGDELVTLDLVLEYMGSAGLEFYLGLTDAVIDGNPADALIRVDQMIKDGKDSKQLLADWLLHYRDLMISKYLEDPSSVVNASGENVARLKAQAARIEPSRMESSIRLLSEYVNQTRYSAQPRILLETAIIQLLTGNFQTANAGITEMRMGAQNMGNLRQAQAQQPRPQMQQSQPRPQVQHPQPRPQAAQMRPQNQQAVQQQAVSVQQKQEPVQQEAPKKSAEPTVFADNNVDKVWNRIVEEISRFDFSFKVMVGDWSRAISYKNDELLVLVKKNKLGLAEAAKDNVERVVKQILGANAFITFKAGDINQVSVREREPMDTPEVPEVVEELPFDGGIDVVEADEMFEEQNDIFDEIAGDAASILGIAVDVVDM